MKVAVMSDLHGEFHGSLPKIKSPVDIIILAGDIVVGWSYSKSQHMIKEFCGAHPDSTVLWVFGNHEFYGCPDMNILIPAWKEWCKDNTPNLHILDNEVFIAGNIVFHGSTLWTGFNSKGVVYKEIGMIEAQRNISDFYKIGVGGEETIKAKQMEVLHNNSVKFLTDSLVKHKDKTNIVITHFPPLLECKHPHILEGILDCYFNNDLTDMVLDNNIHMWVYGHNHWSDEFAMGNTRLVSNQLGYPKESTAYQQDVILVV